MNKSKRHMGRTELNAGVYDKAKGKAVQVGSRTNRLVREHPAPSALVTFFIGCGMGMLTGVLLTPASRREPRWHERVGPGWLSRGQLAKAVERLVPDAVSRYLLRRG